MTLNGLPIKLIPDMKKAAWQLFSSKNAITFEPNAPPNLAHIIEIDIAIALQMNE